MPDYEYDVFISYERDGLTTEWITEHFLPHFRTWLRQEVRAVCLRPAQPIFFDKSQTDPGFPTNLKLQVAGIEPGSNWDEALKDAIRVSRCMVGIWNPPYFDSHWCNIEWESFDRRAESTGRRVLLAANFHDGLSFPPKAAARQRIDFSPYTLFGSALVNSRKYEDFQAAVKLLAQQVAIAIRDAPPFEVWPIADEITPPPAPPPLAMPRL
jgi:TIR domain